MGSFTAPPHASFQYIPCQLPRITCTSRVFLSLTLVSLFSRYKLPRAFCTLLNNRFSCFFGNICRSAAPPPFFETRPGADKVENLIRLATEGKRKLFMSVVNWGEVYYSTWRTRGPGVALKTIEDIKQLPIEIVDVDLALTHIAAELFANHKLHYSDCFAAALALSRKAPLFTSDSDFSQVEKRVDILWVS